MAVRVKGHSRVCSLPCSSLGCCCHPAFLSSSPASLTLCVPSSAHSSLLCRENTLSRDTLGCSKISSGKWVGWGFSQLKLRPCHSHLAGHGGLCWPCFCCPSKSHAGRAWEPPGLQRVDNVPPGLGKKKNLKSKKMVFKCFFCLKMCSWLSLYLSLLFFFFLNEYCSEEADFGSIVLGTKGFFQRLVAQSCLQDSSSPEAF